MIPPVTRTKVVLPRRRPDLFSRQRLLDLLYDLLDDRLIIVAAPAGYGKTSLLVDLAHQIELPVCWYALDSLDHDPRRFIAHFIAAIAQRFPAFGPQSAAALQSTSQSHLDLGRLVTTIVNEAYERIQEHFVLVLDDYHLVDENQEISAFVNRFIQQVDDNCHVVIVSRTLLSLPDLPLMVARSQVGGLSFEELAFRADEIQALVLQNHHLTMPDSAAQELVQETEGWITGLLLSAQTMWQGMADRLRVARVSGVGLYEYLAQQVLDQQPAPIRDFLLRTSLLEEFDAGLCEAVLGAAAFPSGEDWRSVMNTVLRSNLFVLPVGEDGSWLRYHHLFRDFLQARFEREQPNQAAAILRRLAGVYTGRGEWEKAHAIYGRLGDVQATADLVERAGPPLTRSGRLTTLRDWLDALPAATLASRPALLSLHGDVAVMLGEVAHGLVLLNQAEAACRAAGDRPHLARTLVRRAVAHRFLGNYEASLADADEALAVAGQAECPRAVHAEALRARGMGFYQIGRLSEAIDWLTRALTAYSALGEAQNVAMLLLELGMAYRVSGDYTSAEVAYRRALRHWRTEKNLAWQANLLNNLGVLQHLRGNYEEAATSLEEGLGCARQSGYARIETFLLASIGDLYSDLDAPDAALAAYRQARETARRINDGFVLFYVDVAEAAGARSNGDLAGARELLEAAGRRARASGSHYEQGLHQLEVGRLARAEGRARQAIAHLREAAHHFDTGGQQIEAARTHLSLADASRAVADERAALDHLGRAFQIVSVLESQHVLVVAGRGARALLESVQEDRVVGRQAVQLLKQVDQFEQAIPILRRQMRRQTSSVSFVPPKLTIQALGQARVMVDGKPVSSGDWKAHGARDLFFCLLAHPDGLTKEAVGTIFWPDDSPAQLKLKFKNTIYRLRHALEQNVVVFDDERYSFNRGLDYEYDVETFVGSVEQARAATNPTERVAAYRAAVDLYRGPYLPEVEGGWVWPERERLWQAYVEAILKLARSHLEGREYSLALEYCWRILAEDPCLEEAHRLAMRVHAATGNRAAISRQYERCCRALREGVDAPPSAQTEALYKTLMR